MGRIVHMNEKNEDGATVKRIIDLLHNSRKKQKVNVEQLCAGICTSSMLSKVESGKRSINRNCLNRLLARLGIDQKKYEKYLYYNDYDEWKVKNDIINAIEDGELQKAEKLVGRYESEYANAGKIELQFSLFMKIQILQHKKDAVDSKEIENLYREAMLLTVPGAYEEETSKLLLSTDELNLVLECRNRELDSEDVYEIYDIYKGFIDYIDNSRFDINGKAKIYPKVVVYMYNHIAAHIDSVGDDEKSRIYKKLLGFYGHAIDILRSNNRSYYLCELYQSYIGVLTFIAEYDNDEKYVEAINQTREILQTYIELCERYRVPYLMIDCCYLYREDDVYCINDVMRQRRKMLGMTMTDLCDNICSTRTLRRFERKESNAIEGIVDELFWRLGMSVEYVNMRIVTDSQDAADLHEKCRRAINAKNLELASEILRNLECILPKCRVNDQAIMELKCLIGWYKGNIGYEQHINELKEVMRYTIDIDSISTNGKNMLLSWIEISCINNIAMCLKKMNKYQEALDYTKVLIEYFKQFEEQSIERAFIGLYEMVLSFYGSLIGSMGMHMESNCIFDKLNKLLLKLKRTNIIHFNVYNIAWNNQEISHNKEEYYSEIKKCINLCQLTKNKFYEANYLERLK